MDKEAQEYIDSLPPTSLRKSPLRSPGRRASPKRTSPKAKRSPSPAGRRVNVDGVATLELEQYPKLNALEDLQWVTAPRPEGRPTKIVAVPKRSPGEVAVNAAVDAQIAAKGKAKGATGGKGGKAKGKGKRRGKGFGKRGRGQPQFKQARKDGAGSTGAGRGTG